ncbi:hypothetical protein [Labilibaculum sp.]|uniref:hypothetical protein n=1 Tax=Labilibaculum sp. TaxID=2060723 RepID=UPI00356885E1
MGRIHYQLKKRIYRLKAYRRKGFGVHSPFTFHLISNVIEAKLQYYAFAVLSPYRKVVANGLKVKMKEKVVEKELVKRFKEEIHVMESSEALDRLQFRLHNFWPTKKPAYFGGGIGFSMLYMAKIDSRIDVTCLGREAIFSKHINNIYKSDVGVTNYKDVDYYSLVRQKPAFDFLVFSERTSSDILTDFLNNIDLLVDEECMILVQNPHRNENLAFFWKQLKQLERFSVSLDLFHLGILIARKGMQKQDYVRKYRF